MPRKPIVGGNWKCNPGKLGDAMALVEAWKGKPFAADKIDVVICPTALHISSVKPGLEAQGIMVSAQNVSKTDMGAFTGEWTGGQLVDMGIPWTLIGHSERRSKYGETDEDTAIKVEKCQAAGVKVIFCIGELLEERESGKTDEVNKRQLAAMIPKVKTWDDIVIAYEPVWAIGTGKVATPEQAQETHANIRAYLKEAVSAEVAEAVRIQYGGSVTPENCGELIGKPDIDGFLVGGASLKPTFADIIVTTSA
jgi:triosephosphate isomerase